MPVTQPVNVRFGSLAYIEVRRVDVPFPSDSDTHRAEMIPRTDGL